MMKADNAHDLALLYHLNSEPWLNLAVAQDPPGELARVTTHAAPLPLPPTTESSLGTLLRRRRSCRHYRRGPIPLEGLSAVLHACYGTGELFQSVDGRRMCARPVPSAGGYYPLRLFVATRDVTGLPDGLHGYDPWHHQLRMIRSGEARTEADACLLAPQFLTHANALLFLTAPLDPCLAKYGPRGYRYLILEAGHAAQNVCLAAIEQGLATLCVGGFFDRAVERFLALDTNTDLALYCLAVGSPETACEQEIT